MLYKLHNQKIIKMYNPGSLSSVLRFKVIRVQEAQKQVECLCGGNNNKFLLI